MVNVNLIYVKNKLDLIEIKGHADKLVCAGISSIFIGMMNALEDDIYDISLIEGNSYCKIKSNQSIEDKIRIESMIIQLRTIEESYPKEIKIIKKEKEDEIKI